MFDRIEKIRDRTITGSFENLEAVVNYVKRSDRPEVKHILKARELGKGTEGYRQIKTDKIPCTTINFNHDGYVQGSTITNPTGYMFMDVDEDTMGDVDMNYVAAYWKSLSNQGYSVIVKVNDLYPDGLKESYQQVGELLDLKYDEAAISKDRLTVLSYDTKAYYNTDCKEVELHHNKKTHYNTIEKSFSHCSECNGVKIRYNNLNYTLEESGIELIYDQDGVYDFGSSQKLAYSEVVIPFRKIKEGKRDRIMTTIIHQLIALNPKFPKEQLLKLCHYVNRTKMTPPLPDKTIAQAFERKYLERTRLNPILNARRRFLYNPLHNLTTKEKRRLNAKKIGQDKVTKTKQRLRSALSKWDYEKMGKITHKKLVQVTGMNLKTIQKYCSSVKNELKI
ncbi:hypothetical protein LV716_05010 [Flagellimonas sp. HMM57]|uniref:hypothetical protein n=1 Tax=unclassified Flagellimonas TaxID=2644544 RepID=UPI0013D7AC04|nr:MULTISPECIES: hypothetical protein [unclassified Flagellimonas]UII77151.1 hypothetical protein LV716_05010 [Flagellimonas sp. HMM57]